MIKYIICCDICGAEQNTDTIIQSKFGRHLCFCPACVSYLKAARCRNQQMTALPTSSEDEFETVTREEYIREHIYEKDTNIVSS